MKPGLRLGVLQNKIKGTKRKHAKRSHLYAEARSIRNVMLQKGNRRQQRVAQLLLQLGLSA